MLKEELHKINSNQILTHENEQHILDDMTDNCQNAIILLKIPHEDRKFCNSVQTDFFKQADI